MNIPDLEAKHPEWEENADFWRDIALLYRGGQAIRREAERFLIERPSEPGKIYAARCKRFSYQNLLAMGIGWYVAKLFEEEVKFFFRRGDQDVSDEALTAFLLDCNRAGKRFVAAARDWFVSLVRDGATYVLIDLPQADGSTNFLAQKQSGALSPYIVNFRANEVTNWGLDEYGNYEWIVISTSTHAQASISSPAQVVDRWYYFDRENYQIWEARRKSGDSERKTPTLAKNGRHALADQNRVPIHKLCVDEEYWLGNRAYPQILDHINEDNALAWKSLMSNLAIPVITGPYEEPVVIGETAYIHLQEKGSTFSWSEPAGTNLEFSAKRVQSIREETLRVMHLQAQARSASSTAQAQSGWSKEQDMAPAKDVLNGLGAVMRETMSAVLKDVAAIGSGQAAERVTVTVQGMTFADEDALGEVETAAAAIEIVQSDSWRKQVQKRLVDRVSPNLDPETRNTIHQEIDSSPDPRESRARLLADHLPVAA